MLEAHASKADCRDTQALTVFGRRCLPWTDAENEIIRRLAPVSTPAKKLIKLFPDRSYKAIKTQLGRIRKEMGIRHHSAGVSTMTMLDPSARPLGDHEYREWQRKCAVSNGAFLEALRGAGYAA